MSFCCSCSYQSYQLSSTLHKAVGECNILDKLNCVCQNSLGNVTGFLAAIEKNLASSLLDDQSPLDRLATTENTRVNWHYKQTPLWK